MDHETYLTLDGNEWQGASYYTSKDGTGTVSDKVMYIDKTKFPKKVLLWLCISEKGMSEPVFFKGGLAVNAKVYQKKCLPKVADFIQKCHENDDIVFWSDLASAHYAPTTLEKMQDPQIPFIPKSLNPPNVPQLRPIEDFWANLKINIYAGNYQPKSVDALIRKMKAALKDIPLSLYSCAMKKIPANIRTASRYGINSFIH